MIVPSGTVRNVLEPASREPTQTDRCLCSVTSQWGLDISRDGSTHAAQSWHCHKPGRCLFPAEPAVVCIRMPCGYIFTQPYTETAVMEGQKLYFNNCWFQKSYKFASSAFRLSLCSLDSTLELAKQKMTITGNGDLSSTWVPQPRPVLLSWVPNNQVEATAPATSFPWPNWKAPNSHLLTAL